MCVRVPGSGFTISDQRLRNARAHTHTQRESHGGARSPATRSKGDRHLVQSRSSGLKDELILTGEQGATVLPVMTWAVFFYSV